MPRAIAQFRHDVSFANLNPSLRVTIISPGGATIIIDAINGLPALGARACTISSAPQGRWWGKCATGVADGLPLDDVASAVEADSNSQGVTPHTVRLVHGPTHP